MSPKRFNTTKYRARSALGLAAVALALGYAGLAAGTSASLANQASAQVSPSAVKVGDTGVAIADPALPRPPTRPCVVPLFNGDTFTDFSNHNFSYAPPAGCQGRWSKVVLEADFSVNTGRQFDRTATLWLGGVNIYFGTTQEPSSTVAPAWHVERDLTDYTALLKTPQSGRAFIGNIVNDTYTGIITGSARLVFYPASIVAPAPPVPDAVYPLGSDPIGSTAALNTGTDELAATLSLPRNVVHAYLDVFTQSQGGDEFWYTCVPDAYAAQTQECGGGNYREAQVSIDGVSAGVAPVYPWIYTGGIDPYLWRPTPGVQALNFLPYRVDLSPFAGQLSDGAAHRIAVRVAGANTYFSATAALLIYRDPHKKVVTGQLTRNTLADQPPTPSISDTLTTDAAGNLGGEVATSLSRTFELAGYVDTSLGRIVNRVQQTVGFNDVQHFTINASTYRQQTDQQTTVDSVSESRRGRFLSTQYRQHLSYPLSVDYHQTVAADGAVSAAAAVSQAYHQRGEHRLFGLRLYASSVDNTLHTADTLNFDATGALTSHTGQQSDQQFNFSDTLGGCYRRSVSTQGGAVSAVPDGEGCSNGRNRLYWFSHPDGAPEDGAVW